eukprot:GHRR01000937.1.p1 GENE.GHRR01000937.1~~GHRR01000937.1.p1  ORF type:complete len:934 (+),score=365.76 GHRR01000937.1:289-3090(+)
MGGDQFQCASIKEPRKRYSKGSCIGRGASKVVYKAFDEDEGIEVAWNEVHASDICLGSGKERNRMLGEISMLRQLKHRNIMRLYDWWYDREQQVLVFITELLTDGSLRRYIRRKHASGIRLCMIKRYAWQILQGLVYLHGHYPPIIHRDLKCDNIFVNGATGEIKLGDLGFATLLRGISAPLSVIGTPEFMAPELYDERYDEKVDIYSFGMCLLELATLEYPYSECRNPAQIYRKVSQGVPPNTLAQVSNLDLKALIMLAINSDPSKRPEARQLLAHPFFEDLRQQLRAKGWLKWPPLGAAALANGNQLCGKIHGVANGSVADVAAIAAQLPAGRIAMSAPYGLASLGAGSTVQHNEEAAGLLKENNSVPAAPAAPATAAASYAPSSAAGGTDQGSSHAATATAGLLELNAVGSVADKHSNGSLIKLAGVDYADTKMQQDQMAGLHSPHTKSTAVNAAMGALIQQHQLQHGTQPSQQPHQQSLPLEQPQQELSSLQHVQAQMQQPLGLTIPVLSPVNVTCSGSCTSTPLHSPFAAMCQGNSNGSCSSVSGRAVTAPGALLHSLFMSNAGQQQSKRSGSAQAMQLSGTQESLEEISEEDVLFESDSVKAHTDDLEIEQDEGGTASSSSSKENAATADSLQAAWQHRELQEQQQHVLGTIQEDSDYYDSDNVECVCRQIDRQQLSFNVGFFNNMGMRKRVGFQYNADEDNVDDLAVEMLENLSLMPAQAQTIADKIRAALEALGLSNGSNSNGAVHAAASGAAGPTIPSATIGESAALAIVATAAASAAIESCGTSQPASAEAVAGAAGSETAGAGRDIPSNGGISHHRPATASNHSSIANSPASCGLLGGSVAALARSPDSKADFTALCAQQLVREISMLGHDAGQALLQNLQEDLLLQSLMQPEAAAAMGVEVGVIATSGNPHEAAASSTERD